MDNPHIINNNVENMWMNDELPKRMLSCGKGGSGMESAKGYSSERMADLERRIQALEERTRSAMWGENPVMLRREEALAYRQLRAY